MKKIEVEKENVIIKSDSVALGGILSTSENNRGIILFAHGAGSSRLSPRNLFVAEFLQKEGFATLLMDLLTTGEDEIYENRFDIKLLTQRLISAVRWIRKNPKILELPIGLFGASTGAAAALDTAATLCSEIRAVISRGGRPDLSLNLYRVPSPTLLIVGGKDDPIIRLNEEALNDLRSIKKLEIIEGATHLFEEPGALKKVAFLASEWFKKYL